MCQSAEFASALTLLNITGRSGWLMTEDLFDLRNSHGNHREVLLVIYKNVDIQMVKWSDFSSLVNNPWTQCKIETQLKAVHRCSQPAFLFKSTY